MSGGGAAFSGSARPHIPKKSALHVKLKAFHNKEKSQFMHTYLHVTLPHSNYVQMYCLQDRSA